MVGRVRSEWGKRDKFRTRMVGAGDQIDSKKRIYDEMGQQEGWDQIDSKRRIYDDMGG